MANHKSALKRIRQSDKRRERNQRIRTGMRTLTKRFRLAVESGDAGQASEAFEGAARSIRRAASKGIIPRRRADRSVSRLARTLNGLSK